MFKLHFFTVILFFFWICTYFLFLNLLNIFSPTLNSKCVTFSVVCNYTKPDSLIPVSLWFWYPHYVTQTLGCLFCWRPRILFYPTVNSPFYLLFIITFPKSYFSFLSETATNTISSVYLMLLGLLLINSGMPSSSFSITSQYMSNKSG